MWKLRMDREIEDGETEAVELIPEELETLEFGVFVKNASSAPAGR